MNIPKEHEAAIHFLDDPGECSFRDVFRIYTPQLVAYFRKRGHELSLAEDLAQEVMITVYRNVRQLRDRSLFRAWVFKIARHKLCRHFAGLSREVPTVDFTDVGDQGAPSANHSPGGPAFEFRNWMLLLEPRERDVMTLRFVEEWEYHEIAAAHAIPIGTVQWRVYNSKKKLAAHLNHRPEVVRVAA